MSIEKSIDFINSKILLVGSTGFVGRHLAFELKRCGYAFRATARTEEQKFDDEIEFTVTGDITNKMNWLPHMENISTVIYAAARAHITGNKAVNQLRQYISINVEAAKNCANMAIASGVKRFIYISSIKVNGEFTALNKPYTFDQLPQPEDFYAISKYIAENELLRLSAEKKIEVVIIRPPLVYGPDVRAHFLQLMKLIKFRIPLPLGLAAKNKRSFVCVDNLVNLIITCISHPNAKNNIFLVSDGEDVSTVDLLKMLALAMNVKILLIPAPKIIIEITSKILGMPGLSRRLFGSLQVDISQTRDELGWTPSVPMREGLERAVSKFISRDATK